MSAADRRFMERALDLAAQARGLTSPNPMVGAVLVHEGIVIGEGCHWRAGAAHAEIEALRAAGAVRAGATLYVTLEPCAHQGRTPPCAPAVVEARVARVVAAMADPNPLVAGRGIEMLRAAGIAVELGLLGAEAAALNRAFVTSMRERRPHVTLKAGMTLDGRIADVHGVSRWITGAPARRHAHRLRAESDAIVVGVGTVLRDDPRLDVRLDSPWPREPLRVVLDSGARTPASARILHAGDPARTVVAVTSAAPQERRAALAGAGATVIEAPAADGRVDVQAVLAQLFDREVRAVLVEGGGEVHASFLDADVVDRVAMFVAPTLLGGKDAPGVVGGRGRELKNAIKLMPPMTVTPLGDDVLVEADVSPRLMFTGIVEELGEIVRVDRRPETARIAVRAGITLEGSDVGASVAVNGVCLTVVERGSGTACFEVGPETLERTTLGALVAGDRVNLERPLRFQGALGGHLVLGHVDAVATIERITRVESTARMTIALPDGAMAPLLIPQGSVAVDGISLTVAGLGERAFEVMVIPHTLAVTTLGARGEGQRVNIETDVIGKYVLRSLALRGSG